MSPVTIIIGQGLTVSRPLPVRLNSEQCLTLELKQMSIFESQGSVSEEGGYKTSKKETTNSWVSRAAV